jgi:nuclear cap-binding protein subunit 1
LEGLASVLEADLSTYKSKILKILADCAIKLPDKCTIYTTLIGLLNTKNYNFGGEVSSVSDLFRRNYITKHCTIS